MIDKILRKLKHISEYLILLTFVKIIRLFSIDTTANFFSVIARKVGPLMPVNKIARRNIEDANKHNAQGHIFNIDETIDGLWDNFGRFCGEFVHLNNMSLDEFKSRIQIEGLENIKDADGNYKPGLLITGHFANSEFLGGAIWGLYPDFGIVYKKASNPYTDEIINQSRKRENVTFIPKGAKGVTSLIKCIRDKKSILISVDQKMREGISVPFFGRPAMTADGVAKLALKYDYPIIPFQIVRLKRSSYFKIIIHPQLNFEKTGNNDNDCHYIMTLINQMFERWIIENPGQWFWFHKRWDK